MKIVEKTSSRSIYSVTPSEGGFSNAVSTANSTQNPRPGVGGGGRRGSAVGGGGGRRGSIFDVFAIDADLPFARQDSPRLVLILARYPHLDTPPPPPSLLLSPSISLAYLTPHAAPPTCRQESLLETAISEEGLRGRRDSDGGPVNVAEMSRLSAMSTASELSVSLPPIKIGAVMPLEDKAQEPEPGRERVHGRGLPSVDGDARAGAAIVTEAIPKKAEEAAAAEGGAATVADVHDRATATQDAEAEAEAEAGPRAGAKAGAGGDASVTKSNGIDEIGKGAVAEGVIDGGNSVGVGVGESGDEKQAEGAIIGRDDGNRQHDGQLFKKSNHPEQLESTTALKSRAHQGRGRGVVDMGEGRRRGRDGALSPVRVDSISERHGMASVSHRDSNGRYIYGEDSSRAADSSRSMTEM